MKTQQSKMIVKTVEKTPEQIETELNARLVKRDRFLKRIKDAKEDKEMYALLFIIGGITIAASLFNLNIIRYTDVTMMVFALNMCISLIGTLFGTTLILVALPLFQQKLDEHRCLIYEAKSNGWM